MKGSRLGVRISDNFRALIERYGDLSAASQALMLIGAAALDGSLASVAADLLWIEQQDVRPEVKTHLRFLFNQMFNNSLNDTLNDTLNIPPERTTVGDLPPIQTEIQEAEIESQESDFDPFMGAGIEV